MDTLKPTEVEEIHLSPKQLARRLGVSEKTVYVWNQTPGTGPEFIKLGGPRSGVRYKLSKVIAWENARTVRPMDLTDGVEAGYERHAAR